MNTFEDIQETWMGARQGPGLPSGKELLDDIKKKHRITLLKYIGGTILLAVTGIFIIAMALEFKFKYATTRLGMVIIIIAIAAGFIANARLSLLQWGNSKLIDNASSYLKAMLIYRQKQRLYSTRFISWYFLTMSLGFLLYLFEFLARNIKFGLISYTLTFGWFAFVWFYLRKRAIRKKEAQMSETISRLESILGQMKEE